MLHDPLVTGRLVAALHVEDGYRRLGDLQRQRVDVDREEAPHAPRSCEAAAARQQLRDGAAVVLNYETVFYGLSV